MKIDELRKKLEEMNKLGQLPYIAQHWIVTEVNETPEDKTCYSSFYNGYIFTDLPTKPISTPFDFDGSN
jgi:hypothetical protein